MSFEIGVGYRVDASGRVLDEKYGFFASKEERTAFILKKDKEEREAAEKALVVSKAKILDEAFCYMYDYFKAADKAPNLGKFAQRFGRRMKQFGPDFRVIDLLKSDPRFKIGLNPNTGAYMVMPEDFDALELFLKTGQR